MLLFWTAGGDFDTTEKISIQYLRKDATEVGGKDKYCWIREEGGGHNWDERPHGLKKERTRSKLQRRY